MSAIYTCVVVSQKESVSVVGEKNRTQVRHLHRRKKVTIQKKPLIDLRTIHDTKQENRLLKIQKKCTKKCETNHNNQK